MIERFWRLLRRRAAHNRLFETTAGLRRSLQAGLCCCQTMRGRIRSLAAGRRLPKDLDEILKLSSCLLAGRGPLAIEAAAGLAIGPEPQTIHRQRMWESTGCLLEGLARRALKAAFFVVGEVARHSPELVRSIHEAGHEAACHGWGHRREAIADVAGAPVVGFRAPTFSITRETAWAVDALVEHSALPGALQPLFADAMAGGPSQRIDRLSARMSA